MRETKDFPRSSDYSKQCRNKAGRNSTSYERHSSFRPSSTRTSSENMDRTPIKSHQSRLSNAPGKDVSVENSSHTTKSSGSYGNIFHENLTSDETNCVPEEAISWRAWLKRTLGFGNSPEVRSRTSQSCPTQSRSGNLHTITDTQTDQLSDGTCGNIAEKARSRLHENESKKRQTEKEEGTRRNKTNMLLDSPVSRSPSPGTRAATQECGALLVPRRSSRLASSTSARRSRSDTSYKR